MMRIVDLEIMRKKAMRQLKAATLAGTEVAGTKREKNLSRSRPVTYNVFSKCLKLDSK